MTNRAYTTVRETMTPDPRCVDGLATVAQAIQILRDEGLRSLVIERRHEGDEYGMIVVNDISAKVIVPGRAPDRVSVYEIMSKPAVSVDADMDIKYAIRLLTRFDLSRALVMERDELIGIVTLRDMVLRFVEHGDSD